MKTCPFLIFVAFMIVHALVQYYCLADAAATVEEPKLTFSVPAKVGNPIGKVVQMDPFKAVFRDAIGKHVSISTQTSDAGKKRTQVTVTQTQPSKKGKGKDPAKDKSAKNV